ncbi:hypothetical protein [Pararhodonellum marinum]|uniref:hypothetical protein n=1 Tax=Pararhodonellum marinum TaxID=2755358 RepID=UPI00188E9C54|nr:hypothetical protein [Pararhodonellum marinum]
MTINFANIQNPIIEMHDFELKWRFTEEKYDILPASNLDQIKPLSYEAADFLHQYIRSTELHADEPFKKSLFQKVEHMYILEGNEKEVKNWLYQRGIPVDKNVLVSWSKEVGVMVPWKILIEHFDSFYYAGSDDLTVLDESSAWALLFAHWDTIFFGTKENLKRTKNPVSQEDF